ncbi:Spy/CpxP family protein refolding chaperone [Spirulina major]|uniref:Spy/CpxP family protein refolding chaperone n=1 Tax=Spirulina major TaxID=270636 RepID=UPI0009330963|nr:Spy/CpxP family protein refolding chaperone [Spirulina major]
MKGYTATLLAITGIALPLAAWTTFTPPIQSANAAPQEIAQRGPNSQGQGRGPGGDMQGRGPGSDRGPGMDQTPPMLRFAEQLGLSDAQRSEIEAIHSQAKADSEAMRTQMQAAHEQMQTLMASDATDAALRQRHDQMQALHQEMGDRRFETMLAIRNVLTPEQRAQMQELKENRMGRQDGGGQRGQRGQRPDMQ